MLKVRHIATAFCFGLMLLLNGCKLIVLEPTGLIAANEKHLLIISVLLMLIVVVPVLFLIFFFSWRYRAGNTKATYAPDWSHSTALEIVWWSVPCVIIAILGVITWTSSHALDPYKPLATKEKPLIIEAISLEWKWLFIYPDQHIATINYVELPANVPVRFLITAEGPMNSFQIPQLGGQIYAMAGMQTQLNLIANVPGNYRGMATNFSGDGFSNMKFTTHVGSSIEFQHWAQTVQKSPLKLTMNTYDQLIQPSNNNAVTYFSDTTPNIFNVAMMKYMMPMTASLENIMANK